MEKRSLPRILAGLLIRLGKRCLNAIRLKRHKMRGLHMEGVAFIHSRCRLANPSNITIGWRSSLSACHLYALDKISIGHHSVIASGSFLCTGTHDIRSDCFSLKTAPIVIGNHVWIAANATILPGVHIGNGAVVGACAVVAKDVPAGCVVVGNPAKVVSMNRSAPKHFDPFSLQSIDVGTSIRRLRTFFKAS